MIDITVSKGNRSVKFTWGAYREWLLKNQESDAWYKAAKWVLDRIRTSLIKFAEEQWESYSKGD